MNYLPVIIIGAPRSGTNMLRDVLTGLQGIGTWPCDEINYIWRHGNISHPTDEFTAEMVTSHTKRYIRQAFDHMATRHTANVLIEKTCANSLRVPFVDRVLPEAKYIFIYRDGLDTIASAMKRWKAELDIPYLMRKTRYVPINDLPYYAGRYLWNRVYRLVSREERLAFWGPLFSDYNEALEKYSLAEVCALQWKRCVDLSEQAFSNMPQNKFVRVRYEEFVTEPVRVLNQILSALGLNISSEQVRSATAGVMTSSVGKGRKSLDRKVVELAEFHIKSSLNRYGYE